MLLLELLSPVHSYIYKVFAIECGLTIRVNQIQESWIIVYLEKKQLQALWGVTKQAQLGVNVAIFI